MSLEGVFLRSAFWGPCKTTLFADFYFFGGPEGTQKSIKKRTRIWGHGSYNGGVWFTIPRAKNDRKSRVPGYIYIYIYILEPSAAHARGLDSSWGAPPPKPPKRPSEGQGWFFQIPCNSVQCNCCLPRNILVHGRRLSSVHCNAEGWVTVQWPTNTGCIQHNNMNSMLRHDTQHYFHFMESDAEVVCSLQPSHDSTNVLKKSHVKIEIWWKR